MKKIFFPLILGTGLYVSVGCSKKLESQSTPPPPETTTAATPAPAPVKTTVSAAQINDKVSTAQEAIRLKDYSKAADALEVSQTTVATMNADQLAAYNKAKQSLARQVVAGAAAGDPVAKAAMDKMRQAASYHH